MGAQLLGPRTYQGFQSVRTVDSAVPIINGKGVDTVHSFSPQYRLEEPASVLGCCIGAFFYIGRPKRQEYGSRSRSRTRPTGWDFRDPGVYLRSCTTD